ncbi:MAG: hypothetical protein KBD51_01450 [Candidatus Levybacteria bacterium]|nr:hypothetical protein [Candidatus Levybacteria bacterium]
MSDFPSKRATLTTEEAREATSLLRAAGLGGELAKLSGRIPVVRTQILHRAAAGLSQAHTFDGTPAGFRTLIGAPIQDTDLGSWRQGIVEERRAQRPSRPESF